MKTTKLFYIFSLVFISSLNAADVLVTNANSSFDAAYGLFDQSGVLVDDILTGNVRIGYFESSFDPDSAWASGDVFSLDANFVQFGDAFGMFSGFDGLIDGTPAAFSDPFAGQEITLWATNGSQFNDQTGQHLIYTFDSLTFQVETWTGGQVSLGTNSGTFLNESGFASGGFNNFSNDFGIGGGSLPGFNTVSAVPEPSTYALLAGILALGFIAVRRVRSRA